MKKVIDGTERYFIIQGDEWVECSKEIHDDVYRYNWKTFYHPMRKIGFCACTRGYYCKGDCETCRYYNNMSASIGSLDIKDETDIVENSEYEALKAELFKAAKEAVDDGDTILGMMLAEMTIDEISKSLGISPSAVHRRKERIRKIGRKIVDGIIK